MKYAITLLVRFNTKEARDKAYEFIKARLKACYPGDDAYMEKHLCYHDETPGKPCEVEERVNASEVSPSPPT